MVRQVWRRAATVLLVALVTATALVIVQSPANAKIIDARVSVPVKMRGCATVSCVVTGGNETAHHLRNVCYVLRDGQFWDLVYNRTTLNAGFIPEDRFHDPDHRSLTSCTNNDSNNVDDLPPTSSQVLMRGCATLSCVVTGGTASHVLVNGCRVFRNGEFWDLVYNKTTLNAGFIPESKLTRVSPTNCA